MSEPDDCALGGRAISALLEAGCVAAGVCGVEPLVEARAVIERRRSAGLHDGMQFVYRNPQRSTDPRRAFPSARSAIVAAMPYSSGDSDAPEAASARVARYASQSHYAQLRGLLGKAATLLTDEGHRAVVLVDDNALVDRAMAVRAGLGWLGKNTNLLVPGTGSWVLIGSILTEARLPEAPWENRGGGCGGCERCLYDCPTGALVAPGVMDASKCLSWLLQTTGEFPRRHRRALGERIYGCDDCQEVCPAGNGQAVGNSGAEPDPGGWLPLEFLLGATDEELLDRVGAWYIPARDPRYVRRNALVVLGNSDAAHDAVLMGLLSGWLRCGDDMLVEHAAWAARALGREDLLTAPEVAVNPVVVAEMARPHPDSVLSLAVTSEPRQTGR